MCASGVASARPLAPTQERIFFSEEKKQKTFMSSQLPIEWPWRASRRERRNKSLLVLFFRKEQLSS
jgi:hypothetical protein